MPYQLFGRTFEPRGRYLDNSHRAAGAGGLLLPLALRVTAAAGCSRPARLRKSPTVLPLYSTPANEPLHEQR